MKFFLFLTNVMMLFAQDLNLYQKHLSKEVYEFATNESLIDETLLNNVKEKNFPDGIGTIRITIEKARFDPEDGELISEHVLIDYYQKTDDLSGLMAAYFNGKVTNFAIFDADGRDYVPDYPLDEGLAKEIDRMVLDLMDGGFSKWKERTNPNEANNKESQSH